jgi:hypothetical protein
MTELKKKVVAEFGIRDGGDRAAVLQALHKAAGKHIAATALAKLVRGKTTRRVAVIVRRIEIKAAKYKLPYKVERTHNDAGERVYALQRK